MPKGKNAQIRQRLLKLLSDGQFHSGEALGKALNISRTAIWKATHAIKALGLPLESITGRGYRLRDGLELLDTNNINNELSTKSHEQLDHLFVIEKEIDSTNEFLLSQLSTFSGKRVAVIAEQQTKGRGRRGKTWLSPYGKNIYLSLLIPFEMDPAQLLGLSPAIAISICTTLQDYGVRGISTKWPNDILYQNKKLAGVLIEMQASAQDACQVIIGIGINLELPQAMQETLDQPAVDLQTIIKRQPERNKLVGQLIQGLIKTINQFQASGLKTFLSDWIKLDHSYKKTVTLSHGKQTWQGINQGISETGELLLATASGKIQTFVCGEVSLRLKNTILAKGVAPL